MAGKKPRNKKLTNEIILPCLILNQGSTRLVMFSEKASFLWKILKVNRREEDKDEGYQRVLSLSRVRQIAAYIEEGKPLPNNILVSIDEAKINEKNNTITIPRSEDIGWVIDGQHRLAGAHNASEDITLPVIAFVGLKESEQIEQFVTINKTAKGVPTSLYLDLLPRLKTKSALELAKERARNIADQLRKEDGSPFYGKIVVTTSPKKGELSMVNFVRKITPLVHLDSGFFRNYNFEEQCKIFTNYYLGLRNIFPKEYNSINSKFFQTLGFGALMNALFPFFTICLNKHHGFRVEHVSDVFKMIEDYDFAAWKQYGTGTKAEKAAGDELIAQINESYRALSGNSHMIDL